VGQLPLRGGAIVLDGRDLAGLEPWRVARRGVGRKFQVPTVFARLSVADNLRLALWAGRLHGAGWLSHRPLRWRSPLL
ncbi:hypothetical protein RFX29_20305, partial [Acinetobacter baumannii]|nr:hypothetical protein [Acinetobacter baumannii]